VKLLRLLAVVFVMAGPAAAFADQEEPAHEGAREALHAAEGENDPAQEAASLDIKKLGWQLLNFGVLVFILVKFGGPPVTRALQARHDQIKTDLASAAEARSAAQARFEHQEKRLAALEHEIADIARNIKQEAEAEKVRLIAIAEERAKRIREESEFNIEQQDKQAEEDLRREVAAAAVALAEKIVRTQIVAGDQQRLIDTFVGDVAGNGTHPGAPPSGSGSPAARGAPRSEI
jgi:F-type H+-transporting ATPase subunit b